MHDWPASEQLMRAVLATYDPAGHFRPILWWLGLLPGGLAVAIYLLYTLTGRLKNDSEADLESFTSRLLILSTLAYIACPTAFLPIFILGMHVHPLTSWLVIPVFFLNWWIHGASRPAWNVGILLVCLGFAVFGIPHLQFVAFMQYIDWFTLGMILGTAAFLLYVIPFLAWDRYAAHAYGTALSLALLLAAIPLVTTVWLLKTVYPGY